MVYSGGFLGDIAALNTVLNKALDENTVGEDVLSLDWYKNAFESPEFAVVFSHFLKTTEKADLVSQIKQVADKKAGLVKVQRRLSGTRNKLMGSFYCTIVALVQISQPG